MSWVMDFSTQPIIIGEKNPIQPNSRRSSWTLDWTDFFLIAIINIKLKIRTTLPQIRANL